MLCLFGVFVCLLSVMCVCVVRMFVNNMFGVFVWFGLSAVCFFGGGNLFCAYVC